MPAHAGAAAYIDGNERTFLEKYTDYIWFAILVFSGLGSVGAWLKHYWKRDEREHYVSASRQAARSDFQGAQGRDAGRIGGDAGHRRSLLREALDCYDDGAIEDGDLSVIGLALEQFHHAVADRRAVLGTGDPTRRGCAPARPDAAAFSFSPCGRRCLHEAEGG